MTSMHKYMNPAHTVADSLSSLYTNNIGMFPTSGLDKDTREEVESESKVVFDEIRGGNLDFVTDTLASHIIILNNLVAVCHRKSKNGEHFREYAELSIKAADQLRKSGLALAQIKNVIVNIENLTLQQNNLLHINTSEQASKVAYEKKLVSV